MELIAKDRNKGIVFEIYRLNKNGCLECYTYPEHKEWEKKLFAHTTRPMDFRDMILYCEYNYEYPEEDDAKENIDGCIRRNNLPTGTVCDDTQVKEYLK